MKQTPALRPGDLVSVVAPSSPFEPRLFAYGCLQLSRRYQAQTDPSAFYSQRYLAGSDKRRQQEFQKAMDSTQTGAIFCARGGYGALRLLSQLSFDHMDKPLIGFSDITALHCALQTQGIISIHAPVITQLATIPNPQVEELFDLLENPQARPVFRGRPLVGGVAEGPVIGGNLSVLTRLIGTPFFPNIEGAILFFEDVGERPYRIDRMWQHLRLSGVLERIAGIAMGTFVGCQESNGEWTAEQVLAELACDLGIPSIIDLPIGHGSDNRPFPLGATALLDGNIGTLTFLEGAVR